MNIVGCRKSLGKSRKLMSLAFTLVEVVIAVGIFFMAMFAILGVLSQCVRSVASLQKDSPTAGMIAAQAMTNKKWEEGSDSGDFGEWYPDYTWETETNYDTQDIQPGQDGTQPPVFRLQITVKHKGEVSSALEIIHYSADSQGKSGHKF